MTFGAAPPPAVPVKPNRLGTMLPDYRCQASWATIRAPRDDRETLCEHYGGHSTGAPLVATRDLAQDSPRAEVTGMSARPILDEILRLPPDQRLRLMEDIWESLAKSPTEVPVLDWHRELLDERLADPGEETSRKWEEVRANGRRCRS